MLRKKSPLPTLLVIIFLAAMVVGAYFIFKDDTPKTADTNTPTDTTPDTTTPDTTTPDTTTPDTTTPDTTTPDATDESPDTTATDFTTFSTSQQVVSNSANDGLYTIKSITDTKKDGYHRFVFLVQANTSDVMEAPYTVVTYKSAQGVIRVDFAGITKDESGIGYQKYRAINEQGISKLYHNISADPKEQLYDIGVTKSTPFKLSKVEGANNTWSIRVDVKYPGGTIPTGAYGSEVFSKDLQAIDGALTPDNARVNSYSFATSGGTFTVAFNVSGSSSRPVPTASAEYKSGVLTLEFPGLTYDGVRSALDGKAFANGITVQTTRSGNKSTYEFHGTSNSFRLSGATSPNQVIFELKL